MNRPIFLRKGRASNDSLMLYVQHLPLDKPFEVIVRPYKAKRTDQQNAYWWSVVVKSLADAAGYEGDEVHEALLGGFFGWKEKRVPKTPRNPEGIVSVPLRTTTTDEHGTRDVIPNVVMQDLIAYAQRFGAQHGVYIEDPDPEWFMKDDKPKQEDPEQEAAA